MILICRSYEFPTFRRRGQVRNGEELLLGQMMRTELPMR